MRCITFVTLAERSPVRDVRVDTVLTCSLIYAGDSGEWRPTMSDSIHQREKSLMYPVTHWQPV